MARRKKETDEEIVSEGLSPTRILRLALDECFRDEVEDFVKRVEAQHAAEFGDVQT